MFYEENTTTEERIIQETTKMFALRGEEGFNIRDLADKVGIVPSVIYHYFINKDQLLKKMFRIVSKDLGIQRRKIPQTDTAGEALKQRILFQFEHATEVVAILKYYLYTRDVFPEISSGYIPEKAYLHIEEVLKKGKKNREFNCIDIKKDAKFIAHAVNGFVLEYYPHIPKGDNAEKLVEEIHSFILRAIKYT